MSKIETLIKQYCPNGVEYKKLCEIVSIHRGIRVTKNQLTLEGKYPVYQNSLTPLGYYDQSNCNAHKAFIIAAGAAGEIGYSDIDFWAADDCFYFNAPKDISDRYLYHALLCQQSFIKSKVRRASIPRLSRMVIDNIIIQIPPLPVQEEIVRILDAFTSLEAELEAELEARKKQYEYYRNRLLSFDKEYTGGQQVKFMQLGDVATIQRGKRLTKPQLLQDGLYPVFHGGIEPLGYYNQKNRESDTVMVINVGASAGTVGYSPVDFWSSDGCFCISHSKLFLNKYLYHTLKTKEAFLQSRVRKAGIPTLDNSIVEKVVVPITPLDEQEKIVAILDKFDRLVNDISEGLPAEIEARRKQYEYYRNKLLTFDEVA